MSLVAAFDPQPDELLYSAIARYSDALSYPNARAVMRAAFSDVSGVAVIDFPGDLNSLAGNLRCWAPHTGDASAHLVHRHSPLPYYVLFTARERIQTTEHLLRTGKAAFAHASLGILASRVTQATHLRYCPVCVEEDRHETGAGYWRRVHQLPGVLWCARHDVALNRSTVRRACPEQRIRFFSVERSISKDDEVEIRNVSARWREHLSAIVRASCDAMAIGQEILASAEDSSQQITPEQTWRLERKALDTAGFQRASGRMRMLELRGEITDYYSDRLLDVLGCGLTKDGSGDDWLARLMRQPRSAQAPLYHILLHHFLKTDLHTLLSASPAIGTARAECYAVRLTTSSTVEAAKLGAQRRERAFDPEELRRRIDETSDSLRAIARAHDVTPKTIQRWALQCGLWREGWAASPMPLVGSANAAERRASSRAVTTARHRAAWSHALGLEPRERRAKLQQLKTTTYSYLYRFDQAWLRTQCPHILEQQPEGPSRTARVDWASRDDRLARSAAAAIESLLSQHCPAKRLTFATVARRIGAAAALARHADRLPLTLHCIESACETRMQYALRKLALLVSQAHQATEPPARWRLIRAANLRSDLALILAPQVSQALDAMMEAWTGTQNATDQPSFDAPMTRRSITSQVGERQLTLSR